MRWRRLILSWAARLCLAAAAVNTLFWFASNRYGLCVINPPYEAWLDRGMLFLRIRESFLRAVPMGGSWSRLMTIDKAQLGYKVHSGAWPGPTGWVWFHKEPYPNIMTDYRIPLWPISFAAALPGAALYLIHRRIRRKRGQTFCPACDYDRHGLATLDTPCPECGHTPAAIEVIEPRTSP